jgi:hypothetical protein
MESSIALRLKKALSFIAISFMLWSFLFPLHLKAQCPGCIIDMACTVSPAAPTLCPATLPNGIQNQPYAEDLTFYMPAQFSTQGINVTLIEITVVSVTGLPPGVSWETSASPANIFYPSQNPPATERGCVRMCGTPTSFGLFNIVVNVSAEVGTPFGNVTQPQSFSLSINIDPPAGSNSAFLYSPSTGCEPLDVSFSPLIFPQGFQMLTYEWDFGNGITFLGENPPLQNFLSAGTYYPNLITRVYNYSIENLTVTVSGSNWCGDIEEPDILFIGCTGDPDVFFDWTNNGATQSVGSVADNSNPSFNNLNLTITDPLLSIAFWDEDLISANDNLGTAVLNITGIGSFNFSTAQLFGNIIIDTVLVQTYVETDTVIVLAAPTQPIIASNGPLSFCSNNPSSLTIGNSGNILQWYLNDTTLLIGQIMDTILPAATGNYSVMATNSDGCSSLSSNTTIEVFPLPPLPVIVQNGGLLTTGAMGSLQWFFNGQPLVGETGNSLAYGDSGVYSVRVTDANGCSNGASLAILVPSGIGTNQNEQPYWQILGNPGFQGELVLKFLQYRPSQPIQLEILDLQGRVVYLEPFFEPEQGQKIVQTRLPKGFYMVKVGNAASFQSEKWINN